MKQLLDIYASSPEGKLGTYLLDHSTINLEVFKFVLDLAMPAIAKSSYKNCAAFEKLSELVTLSEEAFAFLVLENSLDRWIFTAKRALVDNGNALQGIDEGREEIFQTENLPASKYQVNCKKNPNKLGRWTSKGFSRYNELLDLVQIQRHSRSQNNFEDKLMHLYKLDLEHASNECRGNIDGYKLAPFEAKIIKDEKSKTVTVTNVLRFAMI